MRVLGVRVVRVVRGVQLHRSRQPATAGAEDADFHAILQFLLRVLALESTRVRAYAVVVVRSAITVRVCERLGLLVVRVMLRQSVGRLRRMMRVWRVMMGHFGLGTSWVGGLGGTDGLGGLFLYTSYDVRNNATFLFRGYLTHGSHSP